MTLKDRLTLTGIVAFETKANIFPWKEFFQGIQFRKLSKMQYQMQERCNIFLFFEKNYGLVKPDWICNRFDFVVCHFFW